MTFNPFEELTLEQLRLRTSMKWRAHPADVLPLWVAEMDVHLPPTVAEALRRAVDNGDTGYPCGTALAEAVSEFAARHWDWDDLEVGRTALVPDVMLGIVEVLRLVTDRGDAVVVNPPVYAPFYAFVAHDGRRVIEAPLAEGRIDLGALAEAFSRARATHGNVAYLLCNPHNPTGAVHTPEELRAVAELARGYGVRVVSDEIHAPVILPGSRFTPFLTVPGAENAFALTSASKAWNLSGLKAAVAIAGPEAAADLDRMPEEVGHGASHLGVIAHAEAFRSGADWLDATLSGLDANRKLLGELVAEQLPSVKYQWPQGTYLAWLDCRALGIDEEESDGLAVVADLSGPARWFLEHARVALSSGHVFGTGGAGHVRLNFATSRAILTEALSRMSRALAGAG
ncbi:transferase [Mycobacterium intracellulare subsp. chimaera]|uniref:cysteine-S-conjugate beta-lyase n=2 Tax=Mycobacterium intracellulare TaxID=1767 RepID=A0A7U5MJR2_MYCIT|nr:MalY/PatB family protein [Mycobacterium intracellulare]ASL14765.1 transferase [Mycobacterium intracellulare subsp. chimaera]ASQ85970.1 cystathionine beta-lyase [Mycobacterium intracellulare subsp. chimaera]MCF1812831.1 pyridoxal phosphate-dependent aminotransferase [Mycobacterium intracellulare subsp. intracellulare]MDM3928243.1 MalY/PatB family protein [Mycobacterium intracellulare subsp. chimaera]MDS0334117.1 pyridoxal phosphate-dependent aminotransferase [Mycobacterium intracellulare]